VIVAQGDLQRLRDTIYRLETVLGDADIDLADGAGEAEVLSMVTRTAREVIRAAIEPIAART